ncbi:hypothetical protein SS50377_25340 [Spironucleus salmonicida]|nr:hypothetical protein SS50377_25340 [Spironucleus salmonicida]
MIFHSNQGVLTLSLKSLVQRQFDFNNSQTASFSNANDILIFGPTILSIRQGVKQGFAQQVLSAKPFGSGCICTVGNQLIYMVESNMIINLPFTGSNLSVNGQFVAIQGDGVFCIYKENNNIIEMENQCRIEIEVRKFNVDSEGKVWFLGQNGQFGVIHQGKVIAVQEGVHDFCLNEEEIVFSVIGQKGVEIQRGYIE